MVNSKQFKNYMVIFHRKKPVIHKFYDELEVLLINLMVGFIRSSAISRDKKQIALTDIDVQKL